MVELASGWCKRPTSANIWQLICGKVGIWSSYSLLHFYASPIARNASDLLFIASTSRIDDVWHLMFQAGPITTPVGPRKWRDSLLLIWKLELYVEVGWWNMQIGNNGQSFSPGSALDWRATPKWSSFDWFLMFVNLFTSPPLSTGLRPAQTKCNIYFRF